MSLKAPLTISYPVKCVLFLHTPSFLCQVIYASYPLPHLTRYRGTLKLKHANKGVPHCYVSFQFWTFTSGCHGAFHLPNSNFPFVVVRFVCAVKPFRILISFFLRLSPYSLMNSLENGNNFTQKKGMENEGKLKENGKKCRETCRCATWLTNLPAFYKHIFTHTHTQPFLFPPSAPVEAASILGW